MKRVLPLLAAFAILTPALHAAETFDGKFLKVDGSGVLTIGGIEFMVVCYDPSYVLAKQQTAFTATGDFPKSTASTWETNGTFTARDGKTFQLQEKIERLSDTSVRVSYQAQAPDGENMPGLITCVQALLPAASYAGKNIQVEDVTLTLPEDSATSKLMFDKWGAKIMTLPLEGGTLTITADDLRPHIQDDRPWQQPFFKTWFVLAQGNGAATAGNLELTFSFAPQK